MSYLIFGFIFLVVLVPIFNSIEKRLNALEKKVEDFDEE